MHDHALYCIIALLLNAAVGGPRSWYRAMGIGELSRLPARMLRNVEQKLNRDRRSLQERELRGLLLTIMVVIGAVLLGLAISHLFTRNFAFVELIILALCLPVREAIDIALGIRKHLLAGNIALARETLEGTPWRHHAILDESGLARAAIENLAIQFSQKIIAPIFWYMLLGLPGLFISKSTLLMYETVALPTSLPQAGFSKYITGFHQMIHSIPAHIAAGLWLIAAPFLPSIQWHGAYALLRGEVGASPERLAVASAASVLHLSLGGTSSLYTAGGWVGGGTVRAGGRDIIRALYLFGLLHLIVLVILGMIL